MQIIRLSAAVATHRLRVNPLKHQDNMPCFSEKIKFDISCESSARHKLSYIIFCENGKIIINE